MFLIMTLLHLKTVALTSFVLCMAASLAFALKINQLQVPPTAEESSSVLLNCTYDTEGQNLYSLKWFLSSYEFYRYTAKVPETISFPLPGFDVDLKKSKDGNVSLRNLTEAASGLYICEVTTEATFQTAAVQASMKVVKKSPLLTTNETSEVNSV